MSLKSFLTRLIWICVLPLVLLSAYLAVDQVRSLRTQRDLQAAQLARNFATSLDHLIASRISALQVLAASPLLDSPPRLSEFYRQAQGFQQSFDNHLVLADASRHMLLITSKPYGAALPNLPTVKGHSAAEGALATGKPTVGDRFLGPVAQVPLVAIAVPVLRRDRDSLLLLSVTPTSIFQQSLNEIAIPPGCSLSVLDGKGELVARRPLAGAGPVAPDAADRIVIRSAVSPWSVVLELQRDGYRASLLAAAAALAAAILGATLVSLLGGLLAGRRLARAVGSLEQSPLSDAPPLEIAEIEKVRGVLLAASAARRGAESIQRTSEERYRGLVENAPLAIFVNRAGRIEYANPAALALFGVQDSADLLGRSPRDFVHPDFHVAMAQRIETLLQGGQVPLAETWIRQPGGAERSVEVVAASFTDQRGPAIQVMMHDISQRTCAEAALRQSEERYRELVQNANSAIIRWSRDGSITFFNEYAQAHFGYSLDQVLGRPVGMLVPPQESGGADLSGIVGDILEHPERFTNVDNENLCSDGRRVWMTWTNKPIFGPDGRVQEILAVGSDITPAKLAERALSENAQMLRLFIEHAPASLAMFDRDMRYLYVSRRWLADYGLDGRELRGESHYAVFPEIGEEWKAIHRRCLAGEVLRSECDRFERADGSVQWLRWEVHPWRDALDAVAGMLVFSEDITKRKQAEEKIELHLSLMRGINRIFQNAMDQQSRDGLAACCLAVAQEITGSSFGLIGEIGTAGCPGTGSAGAVPPDLLHVLALDDRGREAGVGGDPGGSGRPRRAPGDFPVQGIFGRFGRVLRDGQGFFCNDPAGFPDPGDPAAGQPQLSSCLGVPLLRDGVTRGLIALGNREGGYRDLDLELLEALAPVVVEVFLRKEAELALKEREGRLQRAEEMAHLGHWRHDLVQGRVSWSDEMYRLLGLAPQAGVPATGIAGFCHPDDLEPCLRSCDPAADHVGESFAFRVLRPDGEERHLVSRGELLRDGALRPPCSGRYWTPRSYDARSGNCRRRMRNSSASAT
jgi:PAS domain S-box-containing protein